MKFRSMQGKYMETNPLFIEDWDDDVDWQEGAFCYFEGIEMDGEVEKDTHTYMEFRPPADNAGIFELVALREGETPPEHEEGITAFSWDGNRSEPTILGKIICGPPGEPIWCGYLRRGFWEASE